MDVVSMMNLVHIVSAIFWGGGAILMAWFITPAARASGKEGQVFMMQLMQKTRMVVFLTVSAVVTILSGLYVYWVFSGGFDPWWFSSGQGRTLTAGGLAGLGAFIVGQFVSGTAARRLGALGREIQESGGPPNEQQQKELQSLQQRISRGARWTAILIVTAAVGMALGRRMF